MEIVFRSPFYLWGLLVIPIIIVIHFISLRYSRKRAIKFANFTALARVSEKLGISSNYFVLFLRVVVIIAIILSISGTSLWYDGNTIDADYIIAIDSSSSMLANDFPPTRFEASKEAALGFVNNLPIYSSVGVVSFSGISYVNQPLTNDKRIIKDAINNIDIMSSGGTDIGGAIVTGTNLLMNSGKPRLIIILTDGRSNIGIGLQKAVEYANNNNVIVDTIGIGSEEGYFINVNESLGPLGVDKEELELIANSTKGKFYNPRSSSELKGIYFDIATSDKTKVSIELTFFLLGFILILLVFEWVLLNTKYRILP
jgi:Ca-activated chloride channel family protein